jgi:uncharacterized protein YqeY
MSPLSETSIQERLKDAMRSRAGDEVMVLRGIVAAIKNLKIERRGGGGGGSDELAEADITQLVRREIKQREEAIGFAQQGGRADLVEKNAREKQFLEGFLPQALSSEELETAIARHHGAGAASIGALMGKLKAEFGARLDGKVASEAIRGFLHRQEGS